MKQVREDLTEDSRKEKSTKIIENLKTLPEFQKSQHVLFYYTHGKEVDLLPMLGDLEGKGIYFPRLTENSMFKAMPFKSMDSLDPNGYGIEEPEDDGGEYDSKIDLVIVPGVAFDEAGNRIGMGKGYYDRYLAKSSCTTVAVAYQEQVVDNVPVEPYDKAVDIIITDQNIYRCH